MRSITLSGYASRISRRRRNRDLSEQRAHVVERILRGFAGSAATMSIFFFGEDSATTPDEMEDAQWRRATVGVQPPSATAPAAPGPAGP
jgi:outer membrane protein OmpA-like peptidoglycan-associated protein